MQQSTTCGVVGHDTECLCDVRITSPVQIDPLMQHPYADMAATWLRHRDQSSLPFWTTMLDIWEQATALGVGTSLSWEQLQNLSSEWQIAQALIHSSEGMYKSSTATRKVREKHKRICRVMRTRQHRVLLEMRHAGFTPQACAHFFITDLTYVNRLLARDEKKLVALQKIKEGKSITAAAREVGVNADVLRNWSTRTGLRVSAPTDGGTKHSPATYDAVLALFDQGVKRPEIARQLGLKYHTVNGILRRRSAAYQGSSRQVKGQKLKAVTT